MNTLSSVSVASVGDMASPHRESLPEQLIDEITVQRTSEVQELSGSRREGGWASNMVDKGKKIISTEEEDERLKQPDPGEAIPQIPDLDVIMEDDLVTQMAAPPSVSITRVATYNQLNTDLSRHAGLFTLDGDIDLKLLASVLTPEADVVEEDKCWEWDKLFAELSPDIQKVWDQLALKGEGGKSISSSSAEGVVSLPGNIF